MQVKPLAGAAVTAVLLICAVTMTAVVVRRDVFKPGNKASPQAPEPPRPVADWTAMSAAGHRMGSDSAAVTIVEFADFECPACRAFTNRHLKGVRALYSKDVAIVFRHWPLPYHKFAYPAARAAECVAAQGRFPAFYDAVYANQDSLGLKSFRQFAQASGVGDLAAFDLCNSRASPVPVIDADVALAKTLKSRGTPSVIVNGMLLDGVPDSAAFDEMVRKELAKAKKG